MTFKLAFRKHSHLTLPRGLLPSPNAHLKRNAISHATIDCLCVCVCWNPHFPSRNETNFPPLFVCPACRNIKFEFSFLRINLYRASHAPAAIIRTDVIPRHAISSRNIANYVANWRCLREYVWLRALWVYLRH